MGAGASRNRRKVQAVLDAVADTVVSSQATCLAAARNRVLIDVVGADNVIIQNVLVQQRALATASCNFATSINVGTLLPSLRSMLDAVVQGTNAQAQNKVRFTQTIAQSVAQDLVASCLTRAVNDYRLRLTQAVASGSTVAIRDVDIHQLARAHLAACLLSNAVTAGRAQSLGDFIADNIGPFNVLAPDGNALVCEGVERYREYTYYAFGVAGAVLLLCFVIAAIIAARGLRRAPA